MNSMSERENTCTANDSQPMQPSKDRGVQPSRAASLEASGPSAHRAHPRDTAPPARAMLSTFERVKAAQQRRQAEASTSASGNRRERMACPQGISTGSSSGSVPRQSQRQRKAPQQVSAVGPGALDCRRVESWHARAERARERAAWVQQRADELLEQHHLSLAGSRSKTARATLSAVGSQPILHAAREPLSGQKQQVKQQFQPQLQQQQQWPAWEPRAETAR